MGFVGAGFHARTNLLPAASLAGVEIAGLATRDAEGSATVLVAHGTTGGTARSRRWSGTCRTSTA